MSMAPGRFSASSGVIFVMNEIGMPGPGNEKQKDTKPIVIQSVLTSALNHLAIKVRIAIRRTVQDVVPRLGMRLRARKEGNEREDRTIEASIQNVFIC